jgi:5S rRNA maturation endonuclease (ribonuclease M5)
MNAAQIARHLHGRKMPSGWIARCPAHEDRDPSLSLNDGEGGRILVHCHAGWYTLALIDALKTSFLWREVNVDSKLSIIETENYMDEAGELLYQVCRTEPKGFFQRRPSGYGGWINKRSARQVLYRLPEVLEAPIIFVVEGEKDAETLRGHGFVATTNAGGAKAPWLPEYTAALCGREVILIPDNDPPGQERVVRIARALVGKVARLVILKLKDGKDVTDWFQRGHSECELIAELDGKEVSR